MRVCHIIWDLDQGGAQRYLVDLLGQLVRSGDFECSVLVLGKTGVLSADVEVLGCPIYHAHLSSGLDLRGLWRAFRHLKAVNPALIHSHTNCVAIAAMLQYFGIPVIYTEHGGCLVGRIGHDRLIYQYFHRPIRRLVAISTEMTNAMVDANRTLESRIEVVHNGVDVSHIDSFPPATERETSQAWLRAKLRVGIVGRLVPAKGLHVFLEAANEIASHCPDVVFGVVGDGPLREELECQAEAIGIGGKVFFFGYRPDAIRFVKTFDVFLMTSEYEPFGLVVAEAMACSVPVVALNIDSAVGEIVEDGVHGFLVDKKAPALIADRAVSLLRDPARREAFGRNARRRVLQHFTIERNATRIKQIYQSCTSPR